jgi:hypothetical protein
MSAGSEPAPARDPYFPFHALGLRANPFRALDGDEWAAAAVLPEAVRLALALSPHVQILGPAGAGKSTALRGIAANPPAAPAAYEYLPDGTRRFRTPLTGLRLFLLDEVQRLSLWERVRLFRAARRDAIRLVLGTHADLSLWMRLAGLPVATVRLRPPKAPELVARLARRIALAALPGATPPGLTPAAVAWLAATYGLDGRAQERLLYEAYQHLAHMNPPPAACDTDLLTDLL